MIRRESKEGIVKILGCKLIDESIIDTCKEEGVSPKHAFFAFLCCWLYRCRLSKHNFKSLTQEDLTLLEFFRIK